ncbi:NAD(P)-binding protein [Polychaeton citri CBS 116435]|uniref:NAD(P)-binding protein n=1 Tax=Polychaeton citri CBS 116435 TaxID=1314669 RepID=A0A9P4PZ74_9PEZI|nr:NAD(P)-binding protein [Polychaeton citri CBS 116435]
MSLKGKVAIVTGGARGIGRGIVLALAKEGSKVAFNYTSASSAAAAEVLCREVGEAGSEAVSVKGDITSEDTHTKLVEIALSTFSTDKIDFLINNAGAGDNRPLEEITPEIYDHLMNVNVKGLIFMTKAFVPHVRRGGRIVNLSSISARGGYATQTVYAASKAAVEGLTKVWATELGHKYGITVNCINPGPVDTDMYRAAGEVHLARMAKENEKTPAAPRAGTPEDIADIIYFLCSERARWITGDTVCANGGMLFT